MSAKRNVQKSWRQPLQRRETRVHGVQDISLSYEGRNEEIHIKPPNLSARGMFISTNRIFPEGAVLSLRFKLAHINAEVQTRCEVRHCIPGVGIGVEFIGLSSEAKRLIAREIAFETGRTPRQTKRPVRSNRKLRKTRRP